MIPYPVLSRLKGTVKDLSLIHILKAEDSQFAVFMRAFRAGLYLKETGGITYEMLDKKSTKDKNIVIKKLNLLESLMNEYVKIKISA